MKNLSVIQGPNTEKAFLPGFAYDHEIDKQKILDEALAKGGLLGELLDEETDVERVQKSFPNIPIDTKKL
jgi:hypothetical protein